MGEAKHIDKPYDDKVDEGDGAWPEVRTAYYFERVRDGFVHRCFFSAHGVHEGQLILYLVDVLELLSLCVSIVVLVVIDVPEAMDVRHVYKLNNKQYSKKLINIIVVQSE